MERHVLFQKVGHDYFIDFLKGVSILLVVVTHTLTFDQEHILYFDIWGRVAVPIFLLIQVLHYFRRNPDTLGVGAALSLLLKVFRRVIGPFIIVQIVIFISLMVFTPTTLEDYSSHIKLMGGYGPGEYYPYVYVQFALLLPLCGKICKRVKGVWLAVFFILVSQLLEFVVIQMKIPDWPFYSALFFRYTFLIYLGFLLAEGKCYINKFAIVLSVLSILVTVLFCYYPHYISSNLFVSETQWKNCHWPCYLYIFYAVIWFFYLIWLKIKDISWLKVFLCTIGKGSYDIFLFQMFYFGVFYPTIINLLRLNMDKYVAQLIAVLLSIIICVLPVFFIRRYFDNNTDFKTL